MRVNRTASAALAALAALAITITSLYVAAEDGVYVWDQAAYHEIAIRTAAAFHSSPGQGFEAVRRSLVEDYNAIFAVPLVPWILCFGESRLSFELGLTLLYLLPTALAVGSVAASILRAPRAAVFWTTAALFLTTPMAWIPSLRGFPDVGAVLLVALALRQALGDPGLARWRTIVSVGVLLGLAIVFRRHFLFATPPLLGALALGALGSHWAALRVTPGRASWSILTAFGRIALSGAVAAATVLLVLRPFGSRLAGYDFYGLYSGYLTPPGEVAVWLLAPYGSLALGGALLGFGLGLRMGMLEPGRTALVLAVGVLGFLQWIFVARQVGEQYTLHFTPIVVLGYAALVFTLWTHSRDPLRTLWVAAVSLYLQANLVFGLGAPHAAAEPIGLRSLFASNWPPIQRNEQEQMGALIESLRRGARPGDQVFVVASSLVFSPDLLIQAEKSRYGLRSARLNIRKGFSVDSRDRYPIEALSQAEFVVLVSPLQLHLGQDQQKLVETVDELFAEGIGIARDFAPWPDVDARYPMGTTTATVRKRIRPSSSSAIIETLRYFQSRFDTPPGLQSEWVIIGGRTPYWVERDPFGATRLTWHPYPLDQPPLSKALFLGDTSGKSLSIRGRIEFVDDRCAGAMLLFGSGEGLGDATKVVRRKGEPETFEISIPPHPEALTMVLTAAPGQSIDFCLLHVHATVAPS